MDSRTISIILSISLILLMPLSVQALTCTSQTSSCSSGAEILRLSSNDNAHGADPGTSSYSRRICCSDTNFAISNSCSATESATALRLSSSDNAHAELGSLSTSGYHSLCIGSSTAGVTNAECTYTSSSCPSGYACVAKLSANTNAHLSDCSASNSYQRICCRVEGDTQGPSTSISPNGRSWTNSDVPFTLTCSDPSGCQATYYKIVSDGSSCGTTGFSSGTSGTVTCASGSVCQRDVCYYSIDNLGNTEATKTSSTFQIDKVNPSTTESLSGTQGGGGWYRTNVNVALVCSDSESGCSQTRYCTSSQTCSPNTIGTSLTLSTDGTHYVNFLSTDNAGNTEAYSAPRVTVRIDKTAPGTSIAKSGTLGPGGWYSTDVGITLTCSDALSGCSQTQYCTDQSNSCAPGTAYSGQFQLTSEGTWYVRYRSTDVAGNTGATQSETIRIDKNPPTGSIGSLPAWTNASDGFNIRFPVTWSGTDAGSGISSFDIQYRRLNGLTGAEEEPWTSWLSGQTSNPGTSTFDAGTISTPSRNNRTYELRVRATDNAGLVYDFTDNPSPYPSTSLDIQAPQCGITTPPGYMNVGQFDVDASCIEGESGMETMEFRLRVAGGALWSDPIPIICTESTPIDYSDSATLGCTLNEGSWDFQVRGRDIAGNTGPWSSTVTFMVDYTPPDLTLFSPTSEWTQGTQISLDWGSTDSDLSGYELYYYVTPFTGGSAPGNGDWTHWKDTGPALSDAVFGNGDPVTLAENQTYYINITAKDIAGNRRHLVVPVTVDRTPPKIAIEVRNQSGGLIEPGLLPGTAGITLINITSIAYDFVSGVGENKIEYTVTGELSPGTYSLDCGPGPSPGYSICSTADTSNPPDRIDFNDATSVRFRVVATDKAGNPVATRYYFTVYHPLANFGVRSVFLELGSTRLVPVAVRNLQNDIDNVILNLSGSDTFSKFEFNCEPGRCSMAPNGRSMTVLNLNPFDERVYYVRLISSQPDEYYLELKAKSESDISVTDYHVINITTSYPIYFPGMEPWAIIALLVLAGFSFGLVTHRTGI